MSRADAFDAFFVHTRDQLLLETYAISGDLSASRGAVRDAYAVAWQHWSRVGGLTEREGWLRTHAYGGAARRHSAKVWHRHRQLDEGGRATLEALASLTRVQRKVLVLSHLAPVTTEQLIRTLGRPREVIERELAAATASFATTRDVDEPQVGACLEELRPLVAGVRWPEPGVVRRHGSRRRHTLTVLAVAATAASMVVTGAALSRAPGATTVSLSDETVLPPVSLTATNDTPPPLPAADLLLSLGQAARANPRLTWREDDTVDVAGPDSPALVCQPTPDAVAELGSPVQIRAFSGRGARPARGTAQLTQAVFSDPDPATAQETFAAVRAWFTSCAVERSQLLQTHTVRSVGEEANLFTLRTWTNRPRTLSLAVARSGALTYATTYQTTGRALAPKDAALLLSVALNRGCGEEAAGACAGAPAARAIAPLPIGEPSGLLSVVDLPPVTGVRGPWVGTEPERPGNANLSATPCDNTSFRGGPLRAPLVRTFLFPRTPRTTALGLGQSAGIARPAAARAFVEGVRARIRECADGYGKEVTLLGERTTARSAMSAWRITVELTAGGTATFYTAIMRRGNAVSQVTFSAEDGRTMTSGDFTALTTRAAERLGNLKGFKG